MSTLSSSLKQFWNHSSKRVKLILLILVGCTIYYILILILLPQRYYRSGYYLPGLSGWEFGLLLLILYMFLTLILLESPFNREKKEPTLEVRFSYRHLVVLNIFIFLAMYMLLFATQLLENLISIYKCQSRSGEECNKETSGWLFFYNLFANMGIEHQDILYLIWTVSGVFFIACFIFFGISVDHAKRKGIFTPEGLNAFNYLFWIHVLLGSTGWMYIAWFSLTDFDPKMWIALANFETWGYFSIGIIGVFFNSVPELVFMISSSCVLFFLNFITMKKYLDKFQKKSNPNKSEPVDLKNK